MAAALSQTETDGAAADYLALVRALAPDLRAQARDIDERRELPAHIIAKLVDQGFFRLLLPRSLGGAERLPDDYVPIIEAFA
ncbi:MAG: acyl-CoA dehydrogenase family protein, partial [Alphaproteobacteria bacterium]|nr:acyl-CoA dehydrogenase family protein [Alphaproteobacteria bacterium]